MDRFEFDGGDRFTLREALSESDLKLSHTNLVG